ncbi:MAG: protein kinase domain-containing protein, partial [Terriglobia bacterium]
MSPKVIQKFGKYEITGELGQGGMGVVYKARDPVIGRMVALKTLTAEVLNDPELLKRFYREAQSAGSLQHPNIVTIYDMGESEGRPYIAMEYVEGESLQKIIARQQPLPLSLKLKIICQFCQGLDHAHKHGVIHRDIKPGNILLRNDGTVKVVDFGIAHLDSTTLTKTGVFMGTVHYSSPEQLNDGRVDVRSDLWSVAVVMYEFLSGRRPFDGANFAALISRILNTAPEPLDKYLPNAPPALAPLISRCLEKDPQKRPCSLDEVLLELAPMEQALRQSTITELVTQAQELRRSGELTQAQEKIRTVLLLDNSYAEAKALMTGITSEIQRVESSSRLLQLVNEGDRLLSRGECVEALKSLEEVLRIDSGNARAAELRESARREQQRQQEARDAFAIAHRAFKQGDLTSAETELRKAIELDPRNTRASSLLEIIHEDRETRAKSFDLKEALWDAENQLGEGNIEEALRRLTRLSAEHPENKEALALLDNAKRRSAEKAAADAARERQEWLDEQLKAANRALETKDLDEATRVLAGVRNEFPQEKRIDQLLDRAEREMRARAAAPRGAPLVSVSPAAARTPEKGRKPVVIAAAVAAAIIAAVIITYTQLGRHAQPAAPSAQQVQIEREAQQLQQQGKPDEALALWSALAAQPGRLQSEAAQQIDLIEKGSQQEKDLFSQAQAAQTEKNWNGAIALYQRVAALNGNMKGQALQAIANVKALQSGQDLSAMERTKFSQAQSALRRQDFTRARDLFQQVVNLNAPGSALLPEARQELASLSSRLQEQQDFNAAVTLQNGGQLAQAQAKFQAVVNQNGPLSGQAQARLQQITQTLTAQEKQKAQSQALQANITKFKNLEAQGEYSQARTLLAVIGQQGGSAGALGTELNEREAAALQTLTGQYDQAVAAKDTQQLERLAPEFRALAAEGGSGGSAAGAFASTRIPAALKQIAASEKPAAAPAAPPAPARAPEVSVLTSGNYQPWRGPVRRGQLLPEYNIEGGLTAVSLALPHFQGAPPGSIASIKINIDEAGDVTPDHVINDTSGQG